LNAPASDAVKSAAAAARTSTKVFLISPPFGSEESTPESEKLAPLSDAFHCLLHHPLHWRFRPGGRIVGSEFADEIDTVGAGVSDFGVGDAADAALARLDELAGEGWVRDERSPADPAGLRDR